MIEENKSKNIAEELGKATRAANAAALLFENGFVEEAISRLYYFLLYHVRAMLLTKGLEPRSHEGALRLLGLHFVKEGVLQPQISHVFSKLMKYREEADYNPSYVFTSEDYLEFEKEAKHVSGAMEQFLKDKGYL